MSVMVEIQPTFDPGGVRPRPPSQGSMHSSSPELVREDLLEVWPEKCAYVVSEILQTEVAYLQALDDIMQGYQTPLTIYLQSSGSEGAEEFIRTVFGNIGTLRNTNYLLLERLNAGSTDPHEFGEAFTNTEEDFSVYTEYCTNYSRAEELLRIALQQNKELRNFIMHCQQQVGHALPLTSYLIKPVQRITKYHLLLKELLKPFNPEHYGHPSLQRALGVMASIAGAINEVKKQEENALRVQELQSCVTSWSWKAAQKDLSAYGKLLFEDRCHVGKARAEREVLLFQKLLLILKKKDTKRYSYKGHLLTEELCLDEDSIDGPSFIVKSQQHSHLSYHIQTRSNRVQEEWTRRIKQLLSPSIPEEEEEVKHRKTAVSSVREQRKRARRDIQSEPIFGTKRVRQRKRPYARKTIFEAFSSPTTTTEPEEVQLSLRKRSREDTYAIPEEHPANLLLDTEPEPVSQEQRSASQESLLSLSDVELEEEREEHLGVAEGIDAPPTRRGPRRTKSQLKRSAAICVRKPVGDSQSSTASLIRIKARLAREASQSPPPKPEPAVDMEGEDSLLRLLGSAEDEQPMEDQSLPWESEDSVGPSAVVVPDGDEIDEDDHGSEDDGIVIVEGSSDSEDENEDMPDEAESPSALPLMESEEGRTVPDSSTPPEDPYQQEYHQVDSSEITQFFKKLSRGTTPEEEGLQGEPEQPPAPHQQGEVFQFKGVADTFATLPRKTYQRATQLSPQKKKISKSSMSLAHPPDAAPSQRSSRFNCLVEFTRLQSTPATPQKYDLSQSLPVGQRLLSLTSEEGSVSSSLSISLHESELQRELVQEPLPAVWESPGLEEEAQPLDGQSESEEAGLVSEAREVETVQELLQNVPWSVDDSASGIPPVEHSASGIPPVEQILQQGQAEEPVTEPESTQVSSLASDPTHPPFSTSEGLPPPTVETEDENTEREDETRSPEGEDREEEEREEKDKEGREDGEVEGRDVFHSPGMESQLSKRLIPHPSVEDRSTLDLNGTSAQNRNETNQALVSSRVAPLMYLRRTRLWGCMPSVRKGFLLFGIVALASFTFAFFSLNSRFSTLLWSSSSSGRL